MRGSIMNHPVSHPIIQVKTETPLIKTFEFHSKSIAENAKPGQFIMLWIPGINEIPMGLSYIGCAEDNWTIWVTVARVGESTNQLHSFRERDIVGLRGPFGNGFSIDKELITNQNLQNNVLLVGGGCGVASIRPLIPLLLKHGCHITCVTGAKTKVELLFKSEFEQLSLQQIKAFNYIACTDDGSWGVHGTVTKHMQIELNQMNYQQIFTCGPELMIKQAYEIAQHWEIPIQASLAERIIKCAVGLCGQCVLDPLGVRLCVEGTVFSGDVLAKIEDFGSSTRNKAGQRTPL